MAVKVDEKVLERILYLRAQGLTQAIIGTRLGLSSRTIRFYLSLERKKQEKNADEAFYALMTYEPEEEEF